MVQLGGTDHLSGDRPADRISGSATKGSMARITGRRAGPTDPIGRPAGQLRRDEGWPNQRAHPPPLPGSVLIWPEPRCDPGAENDGGYNTGRENTPFRNEDHERWLRFERRIIRTDYVGAHPEHKPQHRQAYSKPQKSPAQIHLVVRRSATIAALTAACGLSTGG
jgi:hypothetical protein